MSTNEERREAAKRKLEDRLEAERQQAHKRRMTVLGIVGVVALAAVATGAFFGFRAWDNSRHTECTYAKADDPFASLPTDEQMKQQTPADQQEEAAKLLALYREGMKQKRTAPPPEDRTLKSGTVHITFDTSQGALPITMNRADAPCNVNAIESLAGGDYYKDVACHAMTVSDQGGAVLCGDPTGTAMVPGWMAGGNPGWVSPTEKPQNLKAAPSSGEQTDPTQQPVVYPRGTVAVANVDTSAAMQGGSGNPTGSATLYFFLQDTPMLPDFAVVGTVDKNGLAVLDKIKNGGIAAGPISGTTEPGKPLQSGVPKNKVVIEKTSVDK
ncbi:MAG: peptidylprolyl isomerase [Gordonia sp. (in: high G+C Gram-positive bacteria)]|uniref:peptidylprolyl isomerase n=1 Tax=Gordonia sp. (in: high G+C Gram-positive bacteria) TaxID=84139 RepID=UPI0039E24EAD